MSSQLDADRLDYVRRDAQLAGIHNVQPDIERLIGHLFLHDEAAVVVHRKAFDVVESLLLGLDHLYERVYFHKTVRAASLQLTALIRRAAEDPDAAGLQQADPLRKLLENGHEVDLCDYLQLSDTTIWKLVDLWRTSEDVTLRYLASRLSRRTLPKALSLPLHKNDDVIRLVDKARELVAANRELNAIDPKHLIYVDDARRVNYKRYSPPHAKNNKKKQSILIGDEHSEELTAIEDEERSIVPSVIKRIYKGRLYVPVEVHEEMKGFAGAEGIEINP